LRRQNKSKPGLAAGLLLFADVIIAAKWQVKVKSLNVNPPAAMSLKPAGMSSAAFIRP
jgi:hypothetical protein